MGGSGSPSESMSPEGPFQSWSSLVGMPMLPGGLLAAVVAVRSPIGGSGSPMRPSPGEPFLPRSSPVWERSWQMGPASAEAGSSPAPFQPSPSRSGSQTTYQQRSSPHHLQAAEATTRSMARMTWQEVSE